MALFYTGHSRSKRTAILDDPLQCYHGSEHKSSESVAHIYCLVSRSKSESRSARTWTKLADRYFLALHRLFSLVSCTKYRYPYIYIAATQYIDLAYHTWPQLYKSWCCLWRSSLIFVRNNSTLENYPLYGRLRLRHINHYGTFEQGTR